MLSKIYELQNSRSLALIEEEITEPNDSELVAETVYSAISPGTELAAWKGMPPLRPSRIYPRLVGYCNVARVTKVGTQIDRIEIGDWIITHQSHRNCFKVDQRDVLVSFKDLTDEEARIISTTYLYHLGYSALLKGEYFPGHKVGVVGLGTLGYTTASLVSAFGGAPVVFTNQQRNNEAFKRQTVCINGKSKQTSNFGKFDLIISTSDTWEDYLLSLELLREGGTCVLLGFPGRGKNPPEFNPLDSRLLYDKQLSIKYAGYVTESDVSKMDVRFTLKRNMNYLANLILQGKLDTKGLSSNVIGWIDLEKAYKALENRVGNDFTGVLKWR